MLKKIASIIPLLLPISAYSQGQASRDSSSSYICIIDPMPSYPGGHEEMNTFIRKNLKYPKTRKCVEGAVYVQFVVNKDGSLSEFKIIRGLGDPFDNTAIDLVKKMPTWIPAKGDDNVPIQTRIIIPIKFNL